MAALQKVVFSLSLVSIGALACKPPASATLKDASAGNKAVVITNCYTQLNVAKRLEASGRGKGIPIQVMFASGGCLDQDGVDVQTLDRPARGGEAFYDAQGSEFPMGRAPKYAFCLVNDGKTEKVVLRGNCDDDKNVVEVGTVGALGAIQMSPAIVHSDIAHHGDVVTKATYKHFTRDEMEIWLFGKMPAGLAATGNSSCRQLRKTRSPDKLKAMALAASQPRKLTAAVATTRPVFDQNVTITFYGHILPMLSSTAPGANYGCITCHEQMRNPEVVKDYINNGKMLSWVKPDQTKGYAPMPTFGNDMTAEDVGLFERWKEHDFDLGTPPSADEEARAFYANAKASPRSQQVETPGDGRSCQ